MRTSSKKLSKNNTDIDVLVRLGVLEKLTDTLIDRVAKVESLVSGSSDTVSKILEVVANLQRQSEEVWDNVPTTVATGDAVLESKDKQPIEKDELGHILDS